MDHLTEKLASTAFCLCAPAWDSAGQMIGAPGPGYKLDSLQSRRLLDFSFCC